MSAMGLLNLKSISSLTSNPIKPRSHLEEGLGLLTTCIHLKGGNHDKRFLKVGTTCVSPDRL